jgi:hypothetical protein
MQIDNLVKIAQFAVYLLTSAGICLSVFTYLKNNKVKRGEWLKSLYEKFFEAGSYKKIRREIEYERLGIFLGLNDKEIATNEENEEQLVDFLNFFDFISSLQIKGHIKKDEVKDLFGYYLQKLKENKFIAFYIKTYGFENLSTVLDDYQ